MTRSILFAAIASALLLTPLAASAAPEGAAASNDRLWRLSNRAQSLGQRIRGGIADGSLTRYEARSLRTSQRRIFRTIRRMEHQGWVSHRDVRQVRRMIERQSRRIARLRHNHASSRTHRGWRNQHSRSDRRGDRGRRGWRNTGYNRR